MGSITKLNIQYAHRFIGYGGEAEYLRGHSGFVTIDVRGYGDKRTGFVYSYSKINYIIWAYLENFYHALIMQENDPLLPKILEVYEKQGIKEGTKTNTNMGLPIENELAKAYPECRLVVVKKVATCENLIEVFYSLLKDKLNIKKMVFASGDNCASTEF